MYDNEFETKEIKFEPRIKMTHKIIETVESFLDLLPVTLFY